jgi:hypothetical protein
MYGVSTFYCSLITQTIHVEFDIERYSPPKENGRHSNIDLFIEHPKRTVLVEVKTRTYDLHKLIDRHNSEAKPNHKPKQLFEKLEAKFCEVNSNIRLQGVWINTYVQQPYNELIEGFNRLNKNKVHFAVLGGETEKAFILTKREEDKKLLLNLFRLTESDSFIFFI